MNQSRPKRFINVLTDDPIIGKVLLRYKYEPERKPYVHSPERLPLKLPTNAIANNGETSNDSLTIFDKTKLAFKLIPHFFKFITGVTVNNWKTTVTGLIGAVALIINAVTGVQIPEQPIIAVTLFLIGLFAKDGDK